MKFIWKTYTRLDPFQVIAIVAAVAAKHHSEKKRMASD